MITRDEIAAKIPSLLALKQPNTVTKVREQEASSLAQLWARRNR
jgi:hypothetical protein